MPCVFCAPKSVFFKNTWSIIILYRFKTFKQVSIPVQTVQAIYLHKQHSSSNKMRFTAVAYIYFRSTRECNRSSNTHQGSHGANTAHQSSSLCPEKRKFTKFQIRISLYIFLQLQAFFFCRHKLNGTHFTRYFLYHYTQCGTKVTWRYRQHGNWKLLTQHLN